MEEDGKGWQGVARREGSGEGWVERKGQGVYANEGCKHMRSGRGGME